MTTQLQHPAAACLEVRSVGKSYGPTAALHDVSLAVARGEVHALLGHNGSGKSTMVKIISGFVEADAGSVTVTGRSGAGALVGVVHQDLALSTEATVLENCCMSGYRTNRWGFIDWKSARRAIEPLLERLSAEFGPDDLVGELSPANQAIVAIARALGGRQGGRPGKVADPVGGLDLLILDEATARLRGADAEKVLSTARRVAAHGGGVLLVTHHMAEVLAAADRATVLTNGRVSGTVTVADTSEAELLELVSGRKLPPRQPWSATTRAAQPIATLVVSGLTGNVVTDIGFSVAAGEIVGLTGASGAGFEEVPYLLAGAVRAAAGVVTVDGTRASGAVGRRRRLGISLVPADRLGYGLLGSATNRENLSPLVRARHTVAGFNKTMAERRWAAEVCTRFGVLSSDSEAMTGSLSGGNQQKVLLARAMEDRPKVLVLHEPTQGVDEGTRRGLVGLVREIAATGTAVLYVSSDLEEVAGCADRVLVFRDGSIVREIPGGLAQTDDIYAASYLATTWGEAS